jgi:uncharacterized C2H2 Zn-finger protein
MAADPIAPKPKAATCPKCGSPLPCLMTDFDSIDVLRCPECDALFEQGNFVCYGAKSELSEKADSTNGKDSTKTIKNTKVN